MDKHRAGNFFVWIIGGILLGAIFDNVALGVVFGILGGLFLSKKKSEDS